MEKFGSFSKALRLNISESSLQNILKKENLIQTTVYTFVIPYLFYTYTFVLLRLPCIENTQFSNFKKNALKLSKKVVLRNVGNFEVHIY